MMEGADEGLTVTSDIFLVSSLPSSITGTGYLLLQNKNYLEREGWGRKGERKEGEREGERERRGKEEEKQNYIDPL